MSNEHAAGGASHKFKYSGDIRNTTIGQEKLACDCDGYHTFDELYNHRITLFIALCRVVNSLSSARNFPVWRSKRHSDGELCFGTGTQYVLGLNKEAGRQVTYHIPIDRWHETEFAETLDKAPKWDGHSAADVIDRLKLS